MPQPTQRPKRRPGRGSEPIPSGNSAMKVAYICTDRGIPVFGSKGGSVHVQEVVGALVKRGANVRLFASAIGEKKQEVLQGVEIHRLKGWPRGAYGGAGPALLAANRSLKKALVESGPYDFVYERYALWSFAAMEYARSTGIPGLLEVNSPLIHEQQKYRVLANRSLADKVARRVLRAASNVLAVSSEIANYLSTFPGARGKVFVEGNGVDPDRFPENISSSRPVSKDVFTIGFVGSLKPWHGLETLVSGFRALHSMDPNVRLLVVGEGPEKLGLIRALKKLKLDDYCEFTGAVPHGRVPPLLASMDVGVASYPSTEGFYFSPLKVVEYMAAGKPVVTSDLGDLPEIVKDGETGYLVPPSDPVALAGAVRRLAENRELAREMGAAGRRWVMENRTWDIIVERILERCGLGPRAKTV